MNAGIVYGYAGLVEGIISRIKKEVNREVYVVATGGLAPLIASECTHYRYGGRLSHPQWPENNFRPKQKAGVIPQHERANKDTEPWPGKLDCARCAVRSPFEADLYEKGVQILPVRRIRGGSREEYFQKGGLPCRNGRGAAPGPDRSRPGPENRSDHLHTGRIRQRAAPAPNARFPFSAATRNFSSATATSLFCILG